MARKQSTYKLDERVIEALKVIANKHGTNPHNYLEKLLFSHAQSEGAIPLEAEPLGEMRGGRREGAGRKPKSKKRSKDTQSEES